MSTIEHVTRLIADLDEERAAHAATREELASVRAERDALARAVQRVQEILTPEKLAELRRRHAALTPFALSFLTGGPGGDPFIALAAEDGSPLSEAGFDAVLLFAEMASDALPALLAAAAERDALAAKLDAVRALHQPAGRHNFCGTCAYAPWPCATYRALDATQETGGES